MARGVKKGTKRGSYHRIEDTSNYSGRKPRVKLSPEQESQVKTFRQRLEADPNIDKMSQNTKKTYCRLAGNIFADAWQVTKSNRNQIKSVILYLEEYKLLPEGFEKPAELFSEARRRKGSKRSLAVTDDKVLTVSEYHKLLAVLPTDARGQELRALCQLSLYFGLRLNEALSVEAGRFHTKGSDLYVYLPAETTKGEKERDAECLTNFDRMLEPFGMTIPAWTITEQYVKYQMSKARQAMKTKKKLSFHALRHAYATHAVSVHADIRRLSKSLGHHSIDFTDKVYVHENNSTRNFIN